MATTNKPAHDRHIPPPPPPGTTTTTQVPIGTIIPWIGTATALQNLSAAGWLNCDGSWAKQATDGYALYGIIGDMFGGFSCNELGEMFRLPDLRGMFMRGLATDASQDPDIGTRQGLAFVGPAGYTGSQQGQLPSGGEVGTYQLDAAGIHNHAISDQIRTNSSLFSCDSASDSYLGFSENEDNPGVSIGQIQDNAGPESRPKNVYVYYLIYAGNPVQTYPSGTTT